MIFSKLQKLALLLIALAIFPALNAQVIEIDTVVITAGRKLQKLHSIPQAQPLSLTPVISTVTREELRKQGAITVIDAMNYIPGAFIETRGRQVKQFFSVRGQKYPYPDYAINGALQKEFEELPYFFSASDIEEVEIVRSSAALLTGLSGLSGLINIKTREYTSPETNIESEFGTFNTLHSHVSTGNRLGRVSYAAGAGFDGTKGPAGMHAREGMTDLYTRLNWNLSKNLDINAHLFYLDGSRQMTIAVAPAEKRYRDMIQSFDPYRAVLSNVKIAYRPKANVTSELQLFFSHRNPTFHDEVKNTTSNEKDYEWGANYIQTLSLSNSNVLRFGGIYSRWLAPEGKRFYMGKRCDVENYSAVVTDVQQLGRLSIDGGLRLTGTYLKDYGAFNIEGDGAQFKNVTPIQDQWEPATIQASIGATLDINDNVSIFLSSAAGQLKPRRGTLTEDLTEPLNESRIKLDMGVISKFAGTGKLTLTAFSVMQKNAIALSGSTFIDTVTNIRRELYVNRDQNSWGLELDITSPFFLGFIRPFGNMMLMKSLMDDGGQMVINRENPVFIASGGIYMAKKSFDLNIICKYVSPFENERFANPADGPLPLGDFFTADINGGYTAKWKVPVRFYLRVKNMTDERYSTVNGYPDFGRMFFTGVQVKLPYAF
jgi:iron complex outermembrane receptor protein